MLRKSVVLLGVIALASCAAVTPCYAADTHTFNRPDGSTQIVVPVTQQTCQEQTETNAGGAVAGAAAGYSAGRLFVGKRAGLLGLAAGALIGANTNKQKSCFYKEVTVGYKVITIRNGKTTESYIPAT